MIHKKEYTEPQGITRVDRSYNPLELRCFVAVMKKGKRVMVGVPGNPSRKELDIIRMELQSKIDKEEK